MKDWRKEKGLEGLSNSEYSKNEVPSLRNIGDFITSPWGGDIFLVTFGVAPTATETLRI